MRITTVLVMLLAAASPVAAQDAALEDELRAEIVRLRDALARAEALLQRLEAASPPARSPIPALTRPPALNTPPKLPVSTPDGFRKDPPRIDVLVQARFDHSADSERASTFLLRKAEVGIKGHITRNIDFSVELDPARAPINDPFRRTYIRLSHVDWLHVKVGLEKAPIGLEELTSNGQIPFVDRTEVTDRFAAAEEMGVFLESTWDTVMLQASVTNGGRRLLRDDNRHKDFAARAVWAVHDRLTFGVSTLRGRQGPTAEDRVRYNVETKYGPSNLQGAQAEFFRAKDADVWSSAFYAAGFWAMRVPGGWLTHVQPVVRYEHIDRSDRDPGSELRLLTVGTSLLFQEQRAKFQVNWLTDLRDDSPRDNEIRAQYTVEF